MKILTKDKLRRVIRNIPYAQKQYEKEMEQDVQRTEGGKTKCERSVFILYKYAAQL